MSDPANCPKCGAELSEDTLAGLCPKCLVAAGLESEPAPGPLPPDSDPEAPTIDGPSPGSGFLPPPPAVLADKFPQLEILELLGHGGMGVVYKARQIKLDRLVALKIIRPEATHDLPFAERFNREAKTLARLSHQHIVAVHDFGEVEYAEGEGQLARPLYYFLMEFVDGANLRQLMRAEELSPQQALAIVPQICDALQYAHDQGVVHRDIKPENILLDKRGCVKIADFGLAMLTTRSETEFTLTGTHQVMGTLRYMAPEQMESSHAIDHRADIYSLGVVFYEMLTGEVPAGQFEAPSKKVELDVRLDEVVLRSLAREPERRYQQASDVKTDVESISSAPTRRPMDQSHPSRDLGLASNRAQDTEERQREMELAEISPDWLCYPFMGLFAAGWILVGLLWNLRWPGLCVAIGAMATITYYVVQWTLRYLPKLRKELERIPRWSRGTTLAIALTLFTLGMLSVIGFQATLGDILSQMQMFGGPDIWVLSEEKQRASIDLAKLDGLKDADIVPAGFSGSVLTVELMMQGLWAPLLLISSIASLIHTRRYRYTWKHWWRPSLSVTIYCLGMLLVVHVLHLMIVGYSEGGVEAREIRCAASWDDVEGTLSSWQRRKGYTENGFSHRWLKKDGAAVGAMYGRHLMARSWFDGYRASWQHIVLRPRPPLYVTAVIQNEPAQTYVRVQFPHKTKGSPEEAWWTELVDDLEETLMNAAAQHEKPLASDMGAMR